MSEALIPTNETIDTLLGMLRERLEGAFRNGQNVKANAHASFKRQVWRPGVNVVAEEDGGFSFSLYIEPRK